MILTTFHGNKSCSFLLSLFLFTVAVAASSPAPSSSEPCNSTCGAHNLPYPFGFSVGCPIRLNCTPSAAVFLADELPVRAVTADSILISLKPSCNRSIQFFRRLFSPNFAPTSRNAFLLSNCSRTFSNCTIPTILVQPRFEIRDCSGGGGSRGDLSCYAGKSGSELIEADGLLSSRCGSVFSSIWTEADRSAGMEVNETALEVGDSVLAMEIEVVELRWWLQGQCEGGRRCSSGADCQKVALKGIREGFRCRCREGFNGDGYVDGLGCRKASSACNTSKYINGKCTGLTKMDVLITGVVAGASLALISLASLCLCFNRKRRITSFKKIAKHHLSESDTICIPMYSYQEILRATDSFSEEHRLGTGAYGTVYQAKLHNHEFVAIKRIKHRETTEYIDQVINEIKLLSSVNHPNLVHLLGCSIENIEEQILVYELMPNGTLFQHLQKEIGDGLPWPIRLSIAKETAQAIAYLHSAINPPIYHRDVKSSNILLDHNFKPKVADFGLSRFGLPESSFISTAPQGTPGYLDPQYHQCFHLSDKSDVYSFGVVLAEIITGLIVVDFSRPSNEVNLAAFVTDAISNGCVDEIIDPFLKQEALHDSWILSSIRKMAELTFRCLAYHKDMRPTMVEVASELEQLELSRQAVGTHNTIVSSSLPETEMGLVPKKTRFGSLEFYMLENEASCESSMDLEEGSRLSTQELWSSQHSSPSSNSLLANNGLNH